MQCYAASGPVAGVGSARTFLAVLSTSARRPKLNQIIIGSSDTPQDFSARFAVYRMTADGTGSAGTAKAADPMDGTPVCTVKANYTIEPTYEAAPLMEISFNTRATVIWNSPLEGELMSQLGAGYGIGIVQVAGPQTNFDVSINWEE